MDSQSPYIQILREHGCRITQARKVVLRALENAAGHYTSAQIIEAVAGLDPSIGRASVFRSLELFTRLGILRPTYISGNMTPAYVLMTDGHHHHVICNKCQAIHDFDDCGLDEMTRQLEKRLNLRIDGHLLEFYGVCADCQVVDA
ncbi:MAG: Fur family transcriptional regulator [Chloroflexi bacterium]|nr:Fur family transcriptional regulator [Chloroflexota bacterium]MCY4246193.1 Fur family transcriptional regulator [Chloroflexota bacterium]